MFFLNKKRFSFIVSATTLLVTACMVMSSCQKKTPTLDEKPKYDAGVIKGTQIGNYPVNNDSSLSKSFAYANSIANRVQGFYTNGSRTSYALQNTTMSLVHRLSGSGKLLLSSISNANGVPYATETLDVYIKDASGNVFYSGNSVDSGRVNTTRLGYYYYETHIRDLSFNKDNYKTEFLKSTEIKLGSNWITNQMSKPVVKDGVLSVTVENSYDPYVFVNDINVPADDYNAIAIEMKAMGNSYSGELYFYTAKTQGFNGNQRTSFRITSDGEYHQYIIDLSSLGANAENLRGVRFDIGSAIGDKFDIKSVKAVKVKTETIDYKVDKTFHIYSDKLHQEYSLKKLAEGKNFDYKEFGVELKIPTDKITDTKIKYAQDGVTLEYAAVIVKDAGVIGFIVPKDGTSYTVTINEENGFTVLRQYCDKSVLGSRLYNDETQNFDGIEAAAYEEHNPITAINVKSTKAVNAEFSKYDPIRGAYKFTCKGSDFNKAYYSQPDFYYTSDISVKNDTSTDRKIYALMASSTGALECAAVSDTDGNLIPIPTQVGKNFQGEIEEPFYDPQDFAYGESIIPLAISAGQTLNYSLHHLYQNWGKFPLKQISSIQFHVSYYHLSTGVTESNCIAPYYVYGKDLWTLPDFRGCSGTMWSGQPQFNSVGRLRFMSYLNDANTIGTEYTGTEIRSSGPTYADMDYKYISDCGSYEYTLRHVEFPQNDENRTYYTMSLKFLKDLTIKDVKNNLTLFSFDGRSEAFGLVGHTDENGVSVSKEVTKTDGFSENINIGNKAPYFTYYGLDNSSSAIMNFAYIMKDYDITIAGKPWNGNFVFRNSFKGGLNYGDLSLLEDDVSFKAGDTINIDFILLPWGTGEDTTCENVEYVRQDSVFNPVKLEALTGELVADAYIPQIKAENNKAEFKLLGGRNRITVKIDGMTTIKGISVQESVNGEWKAYEFQNNNYDGYQIEYKEDGTYSYSFVVEMDENGSERVFNVIAK